jgi:hypothetical protein
VPTRFLDAGRISVEPVHEAAVVDQQSSRLLAAAAPKMDDDPTLEAM